MFQQRHALAVMQRSTQISFLLFFTVLLIYPETKGQTLEGMQEHLGLH